MKDILSLNAWYYLKTKGFQPVRFKDGDKYCGIGCELQLPDLKGITTTIARQEIVIQPYEATRKQRSGWIIFHPNGMKCCNSWNLQKTVEELLLSVDFLKSYYSPNNSNKP